MTMVKPTNFNLPNTPSFLQFPYQWYSAVTREFTDAECHFKYGTHRTSSTFLDLLGSSHAVLLAHVCTEQGVYVLFGSQLVDRGGWWLKFLRALLIPKRMEMMAEGQVKAFIWIGSAVDGNDGWSTIYMMNWIRSGWKWWQKSYK